MGSWGSFTSSFYRFLLAFPRQPQQGLQGAGRCSGDIFRDHVTTLRSSAGAVRGRPWSWHGLCAPLRPAASPALVPAGSRSPRGTGSCLPRFLPWASVSSL